MDEYTIYKAMEYVLFGSYLFIIFLLVQIWLLWKDVDKDENVLKLSIDEGMFLKSFIYISAFSLFFFMHEFFEGTGMQNIMLYFEMFETIAFICLILFIYEWYSILKRNPRKKSRQ